MVKIKLTRYWKIKDQIDTIERLWIKLKYDVYDRDQKCSLPIWIIISLNLLFIVIKITISNIIFIQVPKVL